MNDPIRTPTDRGFTLVELLIVIVILGILATVTVLAVSGITSSAEDKACQMEEATAQTAVDAYFANHVGVYPVADDDAELVSVLLASSSTDAYLKDVPAYAFDYDEVTGVVNSHCESPTPFVG